MYPHAALTHTLTHTSNFQIQRTIFNGKIIKWNNFLPDDDFHCTALEQLTCENLTKPKYTPYAYFTKDTIAMHIYKVYLEYIYSFGNKIHWWQQNSIYAFISNKFCSLSTFTWIAIQHSSISNRFACFSDGNNYANDKGIYNYAHKLSFRFLALKDILFNDSNRISFLFCGLAIQVNNAWHLIIGSIDAMRKTDQLNESLFEHVSFQNDMAWNITHKFTYQINKFYEFCSWNDMALHKNCLAF